jgi:hypothetical protein
LKDDLTCGALQENWKE